MTSVGPPAEVSGFAATPGSCRHTVLLDGGVNAVDAPDGSLNRYFDAATPYARELLAAPGTNPTTAQEGHLQQAIRLVSSV